MGDRHDNTDGEHKREAKELVEKQKDNKMRFMWIEHMTFRLMIEVNGASV